MRIAVDAEGGDNAPAAPVAGALAALARRKDLAVVLVGRQDVVQAELDQRGPVPAGRLEVAPAAEVIGADEAPAIAFRAKRHSSIAVGLGLCQAGRADGFVSAGNTGALMAGSYLTFGAIAGVERPAMPVVMPTVNGQGLVLLDIGAHMDATARHLCDFAVMGSLFAERVRGITSPRVALLNVGTEERKGRAVSQKAYALLSEAPIRFVGNLEGRELFAGRADVVVTDGFVGNVVLKTIEGLVHGLSQVMGHELRHSGFWTLVGAALAARTLRGLRGRMDYAEYGGTPFLGVAGVCVKCHGSSSPRAMENGILATARMAEQGVVPSIAAALGAAGAAADSPTLPPAPAGPVLGASADA